MCLNAGINYDQWKLVMLNYEKSLFLQRSEIQYDRNEPA